MRPKYLRFRKSLCNHSIEWISGLAFAAIVMAGSCVFHRIQNTVTTKPQRQVALIKRVGADLKDQAPQDLMTFEPEDGESYSIGVPKSATEKEAIDLARQVVIRPGFNGYNGINSHAVTDNVAGILADAVNLQEVSMDGAPRVTDEGLRRLGKHENLQTFTAYNSPSVTIDGVRAVLKNCPNVQQVGLSRTSKMSDAAVMKLAEDYPDLIIYHPGIRRK